MSANVTGKEKVVDYRKMGTHTRAKEEIEIQTKNQEIEELKKELTKMNALLEKLVSGFEYYRRQSEFYRRQFVAYFRQYGGRRLTEEEREGLEKLIQEIDAIPDDDQAYSPH